MREELLQHAEKEIDIETALVRLVDDQGVIAAQPPIAFELLEENAVRHQLDAAVRAGAIVEADLVADRPAYRGTGLFGQPARQRARGDPARLRVPDEAGEASAGFQAQLGKLRRLTGARGSAKDQDGIAADRLDDLGPMGRDRQRRVIFDLESGGRGLVLVAASGLNLHAPIVVGATRPA